MICRESQRPRCKHTEHQTSSDAGIGVLDPRGSRQMDMLACPLGSLLAGIKMSSKEKKDEQEDRI